MGWSPKPQDLALAHHREMLSLVDRLRANSNCIGQLLVGRKVRRKGEAREFLVVEVRLGLGGTTGIYGKADGTKARRLTRLGNVTEIEVVP